MFGAAPRLAAASAVTNSPVIKVSVAPQRAMNSEPGTAASDQATSGNPIRSPTSVSLMRNSSRISGSTGGTARMVMRIAIPASQSRHSNSRRRPADGLPPVGWESCIRTRQLNLADSLWDAPGWGKLLFDRRGLRSVRIGREQHAGGGRENERKADDVGNRRPFPQQQHRRDDAHDRNAQDAERRGGRRQPPHDIEPHEIGEPGADHP